MVVFGFRRSLILHGVHGDFLLVDDLCRKWRRIFMKADGAGLRRAARNDG
jgi:hypothetical protein